MHGSSDAVSLLVKGLLLGMSFGAAIYGEERGGKVRRGARREGRGGDGADTRDREGAEPGSGRARTPRAQRLAPRLSIFVRSGKHSFPRGCIIWTKDMRRK